MASGKTVELTDATFDTEVMESDVLTIVDFWAPWCAPCRAIAPILESLAEEFEGRVKICKMNVDEHTAVAQKYRVTAIPTVLFVKDKQVAEQVVGSKTKSFFKELVERHAGPVA